ncbi:hypothetical protein JT051_07765 [Helicobacter pylori]|nr:hypothetical protein [Helicobacter pylori]
MKIKFSGINDSSEFVSCGRFVQFADKQGLGLILQKRRLDEKKIKIMLVIIIERQMIIIKGCMELRIF